MNSAKPDAIWEPVLASNAIEDGGFAMRNVFGIGVFIAVMLTLAVSAEASHTAIGVVSARGSFAVSNTLATSGATVFAGDSVEANESSCEINLSNGGRVTLAPHSSAELYADRILIQSGMAETIVGPNAKIEAHGFSVTPLAGKIEADVQVTQGSMTVAMLKGHARVSSIEGAELSVMEAGASLNFAHGGGQADVGANQVASGAKIRLLGVLDSEDKHFLIRDRYSNTVTELVGDVPDRYLNDLTEVVGTVQAQASAIPHVSRVIRVESIKVSDVAGGLPCLADGVNGIAKRIVLQGPISQNGSHYLITDAKKGTYEVIGHVDQTKSGANHEVTAFVLSNQDAISPAKEVVYAERRKLIASDSPCVGVSVTTAVTITGAILATRDWGGNPPRTPISF